MTYDERLDAPTSASSVHTAPFRLVLFLFGLAVLHGLFVNLMPLLFSTVGDEFGVGSQDQGLLKSCFLVGAALALVLGGILTHCRGPRFTCVVATVVSGAGAVQFGLATTYSHVLLAAAIIAIGTAPLPAVYGAVIARHFASSSQRMFMWTYAVMAMSAALSTTGLGLLLDAGLSYTRIFIAIGLSICVWMSVVLALAWRAVGPNRPPHSAAPVHDAVRTTSYAELYARPALYLMGVLIVLDYLCVSNMLDWTPRLFGEMYPGDSKTLEGLAVSASSLGVCAGRLLMGALPQGRVPDRLLFAGGYAAGVVCFGAIVLLQLPEAISLVLMALSGGFVAGQAPAMASLAVKEFGERATLAIPIYEAVGALAGIVAPPLMGRLIQQLGEVRLALYLVPVAGLLFCVVAVAWEFTARFRQHARRFA